MYTKKELAAIRATLARVEKCGGYCWHCKQMTVTCEQQPDGRAIYIGVGCNLAPNFNPIADTPKTLRDALIDQLEFELKAGV